MKSAGAPSGRCRHGGEPAHAFDRLGEPGSVRQRLHLEQVAQHDEVVDGAPLVVAAVGQDLFRQLAAEKLQAETPEAWLAERRTAGDEPAGVPNYVVSEHVVLDVRLEPEQLAPEAALELRGGEGGFERQGCSPARDPGRERVGMPGVVIAGRIRGDPPGEQRAGAGELSCPGGGENVLAVVPMEAREPRPRLRQPRGLECGRTPERLAGEHRRRLAGWGSVGEPPAGERPAQAGAHLAPPSGEERVRVEAGVHAEAAR